MSSLFTRRPPVKSTRRRKPAPVVLRDMPQPVPIAQARRLIRSFDYIGVYVAVGGLRAHIFDVGKRTAHKLLRHIGERSQTVALSDCIGTLVIGELP